ncbi:MAG: lipocalin family protein [Bacteroidetes bacterium]|nr:lipocalin family protein [Bacteroidota bacterium]
MNSIHAFIAFVMSATIVSAQESGVPPLTVVPEVDLNRYMGTWYEIARLPNSFQGKCVSDVTATYALLDDGDIRVVNRCQKDDGQMSEAEGLARLASKEGPNTKLKVRFAPAWLSFLPFVWGDYWIIALAADYSYVAIGEPDREYLWILARTPVMDEAVLNQVLEQVRQKGYDLTNLMRTTNAVK